METRQLKYFIAVVDAGSMMKASERLYVAQPALSQQLRKLEAELGVELLLRNTKGVTPTDAGQALYRHAEIILRLMADARDAVRRPERTVTGRVRIGMPPYVSTALAAALISTMRARLPSVGLEIHEHGGGHQLAPLLNDEVDVSLLTYDLAPRPGIAIEPMLRERIHWVVARRADGADLPASIGWAEALAGPAVWPSAPGYRALLARTLEPLGLRPRIVAEGTNGLILGSLIADGVGGCPMPMLAFVRHPRRAELQHCPIEPPLYRHTAFAYPTRYPPGEAARQVRRALFELIGARVASGEWPDAEMLAAP